MTRTVATGPQVLPSAARMASLMQPVTGRTSLGQIYRIEPGTVDRQQGLMILGQAGNETYYIQGTMLLALATPAFLQGYMIGQVAREVYRRTQWIIPVARTSIALCMGIAIGAAGAIGVAANIIVLLGRWLVFVDSHPQEFQIIRQQLPAAWRSLSWFRTHCPVLYAKLTAVLRRGAVTALESAPAGISAEDVASVVGRLLGGVVGASDTGFGVLARIVARTLIVYTGLHLPLMTAHGVASHPHELAQALVDELRRQQATITPGEQQQIVQELTRSREALTQLQTLSQALGQLAPALDRLVSDQQAAPQQATP